MNTKKLLPLALLPIGIIPLITISCSSNEKTTFFEAEGLEISSKGVVMGYANEGTHPEKLEIKEEYNGVKITEIYNSAFSEQKINGLTLPKTLVKIGSWAFQNIVSPVANTGETSVPWDLSHLTNLEYIGSWAFGFDLPKLLNIDLNLSGLSKLKVIEQGAFSSIGLTSVDLRGLINLENISDYSFGQNSISKIYWPERENKIKSIGTAAFNTNELTELSFVSLSSLENIGPSAFGKNSITSILWNNFSKIKSIGNSAFYNNKLSGELDLHDLINLESIGIDAFLQNNISSIIWPTPSQIISIGLEAFALNNFGANIPTFPDGLTPEKNGGITPEQIFTNRVKKLPLTN